MNFNINESIALEALINEACRLGAITLMKSANTARNHGKVPSLILAEWIIAAHRMANSMEGDEPA